jgi:anti-anti-sigma regulatory factor
MLNLLVNLRKELRKRGGQFTLQPNVQVTQLLELTGLGDPFELAVVPPRAVLLANASEAAPASP